MKIRLDGPRETAAEKSNRLYHARYKHDGRASRWRALERTRSIEKKQRLVDMKGGKCSECQGVFPLCCYDFHHPNNDRNGDAAPSKLLRYAWENAVAALEPLVLLCANCHRRAHFESQT